MSGVTFTNGAVLTMGNASGDTRWSTNLQIDSLNAYSVVLQQISGSGTGGQLSYNGNSLLLNDVPVGDGGSGGSSSNSYGAWLYGSVVSNNKCAFVGTQLLLGTAPINSDGVLFLESLNAAILNNSSAQVIISQGTRYARLTLSTTVVVPPLYYSYAYLWTSSSISFTDGDPVSLYFYNPNPFLQAPAVVIPASNGNSTMSLVGSADSLITLGGHGTTFTVGVVDGTDTLKVGPIDINKLNNAHSIYPNVATSGSLFLGSSQAATDIIELSDTAGIASVSVSLSNGTINMGSLPNTVELVGNPPPTGSFLIQNGSNENISLTESSRVNRLVAGTAGLTANSLVFTVEPTSTSVVQSIASDSSLFLGSSQAASDIIELSDTAGVASVSVSLSNGTINMGSLPNTVELAGNPPPTGSFLIQNGSNENISLTASSKVNSLVAGTAGLTANTLAFTVGATTTSVVQSIASGGELTFGSSIIAPDTIRLVEQYDGRGYVKISTGTTFAPLIIAGAGGAGAISNACYIFPDADVGTGGELRLGSNKNNVDAVSILDNDVTINADLNIASPGSTGNKLHVSTTPTSTSIVQDVASGGTVSIGSSQAYPNTLQILDGSILESREPGIYVSGRLPGSTWAPLYLGGGASGNVGVVCMDVSQNSELYLGANYYHNDNIVLSDTLTTINTNVQIRNGYQLPNSLNISTTATGSTITQGVASSGIVSIGSSQTYPNTLVISDIYQNGSNNYIEITGVTAGAASLFITGAQGSGEGCYMYPNQPSGSQLNLGSSQLTNPRAVIISDTAVTFNTPATLNSYVQGVSVTSPSGAVYITNPAIVVPGIAAVYAVLLDFGGFGSTIAYWNGTIWQSGGSVLTAVNTGITNIGASQLQFYNNTGSSQTASVLFIRLGVLTTLP
jgi:hypothetical protein